MWQKKNLSCDKYIYVRILGNCILRYSLARERLVALLFWICGILYLLGLYTNSHTQIIYIYIRTQYFEKISIFYLHYIPLDIPRNLHYGNHKILPTLILDQPVPRTRQRQRQRRASSYMTVVGPQSLIKQTPKMEVTWLCPRCESVNLPLQKNMGKIRKNSYSPGN